MKRLCAVVTLMLLSNAAHAGTVYSLEVGGRSISIDISSGCDALQCISVTGRAARHAGWRQGPAGRPTGKTVSRRPAQPSIRTADQRSATAVPRSGVASGASLSQAAISPSRSIAVPSPISPALPATPTPVAAPEQGSAASAKAEMASTPVDLTGALPAAAPSSPTSAPAAPAPSPTTTASADAKSDPSAVPAPSQKDGSPDTAPPARAYDPPHPPSSDTAPPALAYYAPAAARPSDNTPLDHDHAALEGSWLTEDKSTIRIKPCGAYLCGYAANFASDQTEAEMLVDLKPISSSEWVGMILNQETGITYPAIVISEGDNALRVRSCGMGAAFCGGQVWNRAAAVTAGR